MKVQSLLFGFFLLNVISLELFAQTGINTNSPLSRLEIKGSSSLPGTSGSADNGVLRLSESASLNSKALDFGIHGTTFSWVQPRLNTNYSTNQPLFLNPNGGIVIIGNNSNTATLSVGGTITASGTIRSSQSGQLLNTVLLNETDLGISSNQNFANTTQTVSQYNYTPVSSNSKILIEFHAKYDVDGSSNDEWRAYLKVGSATLQTQTAIWKLNDGAGGRASNLFPIRGVYSNTTGSQITIKIDVQEISGDDDITVFPDMIMTIREVAQ
jgi:hypothetical protein